MQSREAGLDRPGRHLQQCARLCVQTAASYRQPLLWCHLLLIASDMQLLTSANMRRRVDSVSAEHSGVHTDQPTWTGALSAPPMTWATCARPTLLPPWPAVCLCGTSLTIGSSTTSDMHTACTTCLHSNEHRPSDRISQARARSSAITQHHSQNCCYRVVALDHGHGPSSSHTH